MPCRSPEDDINYKGRAKHLESILCAIFNELTERDIILDVIKNAEKNGVVEIMPFWEKHKKEDFKRRKKKYTYFINQFSEHEKKIIMSLHHLYLPNKARLEAK